MDAAPLPMTPPDADLRGMPYMPLDVVRLFDSDFYALTNGDEFKAGLSLWCKAFLQKPAGSLPNDDRLLAHLSGARANWQHVREMALRGWVLCSDGRLYHATVAEKVREAWKCRLERRARTEAARAARQAARAASHNETRQTATPSVTDNATTSVTECVTGSNRTEQNRTERNGLREEILHTPVLDQPANARDARLCTLGGISDEMPKQREKPPPSVDPDFEAFWERYPRKVAKGAARRAWAGAKRKATTDQIMAGLHGFRFDPNPQFIPHPGTWLNQERWLDGPHDDFDPVLRAAGLTPEDFEAHQPLPGMLLQ